MRYSLNLNLALSLKFWAFQKSPKSLQTQILLILTSRVFQACMKHRVKQQSWKKQGMRGTPPVQIFSSCANFLDFHNLFLYNFEYFCTILLCFCAILQNVFKKLHIFAFFCSLLHVYAYFCTWFLC